ncbi:DUF927 domain-containing protein [Methanolobus profundi]|nr:DUF927 domain-containing protein [Methanolobus profundi]
MNDNNILLNKDNEDKVIHDVDCTITNDPTFNEKMEQVLRELSEVPLKGVVEIDEIIISFIENSDIVPVIAVQAEYRGCKVGTFELGYRLDFEELSYTEAKFKRKGVLLPLIEDLEEITGQKCTKTVYRAVSKFVEEHKDSITKKEPLLKQYKTLNAQNALEYKESAIGEKTKEYRSVPIPYPYVGLGDKLCMYKTVKDKDTGDLITKPVEISSFCGIVEHGVFKNGQEQVTVSWRASDGRTIEKHHPKHFVLNRKGIEQLQMEGLVVTEANFKILQDYFFKQMSEDSKLPAEEQNIRQYKPVDTCGWHDNVFVLGNQTVGRTNQRYVLSETEESRFQHIKKAGSVEEWVEGVRDLITDPSVFFICCSSLAAPLLAPLGRDSFTVNISYKSSSGKSTSFKVASSMIGNPKGIMFTGNCTMNAVEPFLHEMTDLPTFMDELTFKKVDLDNFKQLIKYVISMNRGKMRMVISGYPSGLTWMTILLTSQEDSFFSRNANDGEYPRVIDIKRKPTFNGSAVKKFEATVLPTQLHEGNYGHIIGPYLEKVMNLIDSGLLESKYEEYLKVFHHEEGKKNRIYKNAAAIALAGEIFSDILVNLGLPRVNHINIVKEIVDEYINSIQESHIKALEDLMSDVIANMCYLNEPEEHDRKIIGYFEEGDTELKLLSTSLMDFMDKRGHNHNYKEMWQELGIIAQQPSRPGYTVSRTINGRRKGVYAFDIEKVLKYTGIDFKGEITESDSQHLSSEVSSAEYDIEIDPSEI